MLLAVVAEHRWSVRAESFARDESMLVEQWVTVREQGTDRLVSGPKTNLRSLIRVGDLVVDPVSYQVRLRSRPLDLTYKEFELLKYLAQHAGRVFTRAQLLQEVWGYDFFGGTRTVDVHVRRLRAKVGTEHEQMIGTVRNVGYKFVQPPKGSLSAEEPVEVAAPATSRMDHSGL